MESLPLDQISGLRPKVWISVGAGFAREDIKALALTSGQGFVGNAITTLQEICTQILGIDKKRILTSSSRQEILRLLLSEPRIMAKMTELKRIKRQRNFIRRLDRAIQAGRMAFAHAEEHEVYHERLTQALGENPLRGELNALAAAYEAWASTSKYYDLPILITQATQTLTDTWPSHLSKPKEIWSLSVQNPESLERNFWDTLSQHLTVKHVTQIDPTNGDRGDLPEYSSAKFTTAMDGGSCEKTGCLLSRKNTLEGPQSHPKVTQQSQPQESRKSHPQVIWQKWHTLDDAAENLADHLIHSSQNIDWSQHAVLLPDVPAIRRSLNRALISRGVPLADLRDPTRLRWDESLKWALLPLEVIAQNFERAITVSWLRDYSNPIELPAWVAEINARGIRKGISAYAGGILSDVHARLVELKTQLSGRKTCQELAEAHLKLLNHQEKTQSEQTWLIPFFEQTWKAFVSDTVLIGHHEKKAPLLYWFEKLQTRLREATPPIDRLKPSEGLRIYRLQQSPIFSADQVWIFGMPPQWLKGDGTGDYWFTERERELLATEFAVRSSIQVREEHLIQLKTWIKRANQVSILDAQYDVEGRERETLLPILKELELELRQPMPDHPQECGAHPRYLKSYSSLRLLQPQEVQLPPLNKGSGNPVLTATAIDRYSRCSFQALGFHRWNLRDLREPDTELWQDVRGNILHEAVRLLLLTLKADGQFALTLQEALDHAWKLKRPKGLIQSERVVKYVKSRLYLLLQAFCEKEYDYLMRSGARPMSLDEHQFRLDYPDFSIVGQPDRIDQHSEGLFIIDYKSSGTVPHGTEITERGYRLQLPFYALSVRKKMNQPILGLQFVEFDRRGSRKSGIFFKEYNGKEEGKLTQVRSNSKSLVPLTQEEAWEQLDTYLQSRGSAFVQGKFQAKPQVEKRDRECNRCSLGDLCGSRRVSHLHDLEAEEAGQGQDAN